MPYNFFIQTSYFSIMNKILLLIAISSVLTSVEGMERRNPYDPSKDPYTQYLAAMRPSSKAGLPSYTKKEQSPVNSGVPSIPSKISSDHTYSRSFVNPKAQPSVNPRPLSSFKAPIANTYSHPRKPLNSSLEFQKCSPDKLSREDEKKALDLYTANIDWMILEDARKIISDGKKAEKERSQKEVAEDQEKRAELADAAQKFIAQNPFLLNLNQEELTYYQIKKIETELGLSWEAACQIHKGQIDSFRNQFSGLHKDYNVSVKTMDSVLEETIEHVLMQDQKQYWPYQSLPSSGKGNNCLLYSALGQSQELTIANFKRYDQLKDHFTKSQQKAIEELRIDLFTERDEPIYNKKGEIIGGEKVKGWNENGFLLNESEYDLNPIRLILEKDLSLWLKDELAKKGNDLEMISDKSTLVEYLVKSQILTGKTKEQTREPTAKFKNGIKVERFELGYQEGEHDILYDVEVNTNLFKGQQLPPEIATWMSRMTNQPIFVLKKTNTGKKSISNYLPENLTFNEIKPLYVVQAYGGSKGGHYEKLQYIGN